MMEDVKGAAERPGKYELAVAGNSAIGIDIEGLNFVTSLRLCDQKN